MVLTGGEVCDVKGYTPIMAEPGPEPKVLPGDKGYDADAILSDLEERAIAAIIPPKRSRRLATRYDKTADSYIGFILIASTRLWVRHFVDRT